MSKDQETDISIGYLLQSAEDETCVARRLAHVSDIHEMHAGRDKAGSGVIHTAISPHTHGRQYATDTKRVCMRAMASEAYIRDLSE